MPDTITRWMGERPQNGGMMKEKKRENPRIVFVKWKEGPIQGVKKGGPSDHLYQRRKKREDRHGLNRELKRSDNEEIDRVGENPLPTPRKGALLHSKRQI